MRMPPLFVELNVVPPCFTPPRGVLGEALLLRSLTLRVSGGSPPLFVEKKSIMDEELIPHFSGQGHPKLRLGPSSAEDGKSSEIWYQTPPETFQHQTLAILFFD